MGLLDTVVERKDVKTPIITIHGGPGSWKTQFGLDCPSPLFLAFEDGFGNRPNKSITPKSTEEMRAIFVELAEGLSAGNCQYKTLVIDSLDHLAPLISKEICVAAEKETLADFGFGKGYELEAKEWLRLFKGLEKLAKKGLLIVCLAHSHVRQVIDPSFPEPYDRIEPKLPKKANAVVKELSDILGATTSDMSVVKDQKTERTRAVGTGKYRLHLSPTPAIEAKNRYNMKAVIPFTFNDFQAEWKRCIAPASASTTTPTKA